MCVLSQPRCRSLHHEASRHRGIEHLLHSDKTNLSSCPLEEIHSSSRCRSQYGPTKSMFLFCFMSHHIASRSMPLRHLRHLADIVCRLHSRCMALYKASTWTPMRRRICDTLPYCILVSMARLLILGVGVGFRYSSGFYGVYPHG